MKEQNNKGLYIKTFGCQMNVYDSERMVDALSGSGYKEIDQIDDAEMIVLNTCHIREKASEKVYSELGRLRQIREKRKDKGLETFIAVAGCVAQAEGKEILRRAEVVDLVVGPQNYHKLPEFIKDVKSNNTRIVQTEFPEEDKFKSLPKQQKRNVPTSFLTVQEGCDKFCTFCVVPYTRGLEYSRNVDDILSEAKVLVENGVKEITLLGQNVNAYHGSHSDGKTCSLAELLYLLSEINGLERLRFTTSHPIDMDDELIRAHGELEKLMPYLHLPFQAGSDKILKAMNRKHTREEYIEIIKKIRAARPDLALSTDIIVGFPGETEEDFQETLDLVKQVKFAQAYSFKYSPRPGTPAAESDLHVDEAEKGNRLQTLQSLLNDQQFEFNKSCIDKTLPVLFERKGKKEGDLVGRSPYLQPVHVAGEISDIGRIKNVQVQEAGPNSLRGRIQ